MDDLYKKIRDLCDQRGISGYKLCKDIGMQPSLMTDLKMGRQTGLSAKNMDKVANYFGVSIEYLLGTEKEKKPSADNSEELLDNEIIERLISLTPAELEKVDAFVQGLLASR